MLQQMNWINCQLAPLSTMLGFGAAQGGNNANMNPLDPLGGSSTVFPLNFGLIPPTGQQQFQQSQFQSAPQSTARFAQPGQQQVQQQQQFPMFQINLQQTIVNQGPFMMPPGYNPQQFLINQIQQANASSGVAQEARQTPQSSQQQRTKIPQECQDYNNGFCMNGPNCQYLHKKKSEKLRPKHVPDWYIKKVFQYFQRDGMTDQYLLIQILNSLTMEKLRFQDTQSINMSFGGTFSDVMSERSEHQFHMLMKHSHESHAQIQKQIEELRPIIRGRTRFFIVKSFNYDSIELSIKNEVWSTSPGPTKKLTNAFKSSDNVILIFSVNESRAFQGFAMMESEPDPEIKKELFLSDEASPIQFADNFRIRWIVHCNQMFSSFEFLPPNPMNDELPIKQSKNGQELPFKLGNFLVNLIYKNAVADASAKVFLTLEKLNLELQSKPLISPPPSHTSQRQQYSQQNKVKEEQKQQVNEEEEASYANQQSHKQQTYQPRRHPGPVPQPQQPRQEEKKEKEK
ncbi:hypothetical protein FGO68_gene3030 [Halteria grandinella]|uniref:C3H1-type domain-containing protein n=1 Tax=Halteria grandinella TaxID=5974 RepID=A0A8J8T5X1_HALGN|nr:hypothetical protein FGO68_gene3030 [Halteria grandinella]